MKVTFIAAHERVGPLRKSFGLKDGSTRSYPLAKRVSSYTEEITAEGHEALKSYRDLLIKHAGLGHALYKGHFEKPLNNESRRHKTDKHARTDLLVLDIDGLKHDTGLHGPATQYDVQRMAEKVVEHLPTELQQCSYVACASSSFGTSPTSLSVHLHFLLDSPALPDALKRWLVSLNYTRQYFLDSLDLQPTKSCIKHIIDPCLADNSRVVYIAPPHFGPLVKNPFEDDTQRIVLVHKHQSHLDVRKLLMDTAAQANTIQQLQQMKLKELNKKYGISKRVRKTVTQVVDGREYNVVAEPEEVLMEFAYDDEEFVRYNIAPSISNAYWVRKDNPEVVYSFHDGESPFLFRKACPSAYEEHVRRFGKGFKKQKDEITGQEVRTQIEMFIDRNSDKTYTMVHDIDNNRLVELVVQSTENAEEYLKFKGQVVPDPIPSYYVEMNTKDNRAVYIRDGEKIVNRFVPTKYLLDTAQHWSVDENGISHIGYGSAWILSLDCPLIAEIILHMLGNDLECFEHFVNWFAFIFQSREKTKTAWMAQGTEGTGKGFFYKNIARELLSGRHTKQNSLQGIADDQFNVWMQDCLFLMVDEFDMGAAGSKARKIAGQLKTMITEPTFMMRDMQKAQVERPHEVNQFWGTNEDDAIQWIDKRRVNVAPKQQVPIKERLPMMMQQEKEFDAAIEAELTPFATFLRSFKVSLSQVRQTLNNEAKLKAHEAGMTSDKRFLHDIKIGNFAAFAEYLDKREDALNPQEYQTLKRVKAIITSWVPYVNGERFCTILVDDLRVIYSYLADKPVSQNAFGRMLNGNGAEIVRSRTPVGVNGKKLANPQKCLAVKWAMEDLETLDLIKQQFVVRPTEVEAGRVAEMPMPQVNIPPAATQNTW